MNGENDSTRSLPRDPIHEPQKPMDFRKIVFISIFVVAIIIVILFCAAILSDIICKANAGKSPNENSGSQSTDIKFENMVVTKSDIKKGILQIATKENPAYLSDEEIANLVKLYTSPERKSGSVEYYTIAGTLQSDRLTAETSEKFGALAKALYNELGSSSITVKYAYFIPNEKTDSCDFPHSLGTTVDICLLINGDSYPMSKSPETLNWINNNCYRFGFINSDPSGEVHDAGATVPKTQLRYVGVPHATYIAQNNLSFEEYVDLIKNYYTPNNPLTFTGADGINYAVYYAAVDGVNPIKVPSNYEYDISGNNENGVIITINKSKAK